MNDHVARIQLQCDVIAKFGRNVFFSVDSGDIDRVRLEKYLAVIERAVSIIRAEIQPKRAVGVCLECGGKGSTWAPDENVWMPCECIMIEDPVKPVTRWLDLSTGQPIVVR